MRASRARINASDSMTSRHIWGVLLGVLTCAGVPKPSSRIPEGVVTQQAMASRWLLSRRCEKGDVGTWLHEVDGCAYSCAKETFEAAGSDGGPCWVPLPARDVAASWENEEKCKSGWKGDWILGNCRRTCRAGNISATSVDGGPCEGLGSGRSAVAP